MAMDGAGSSFHQAGPRLAVFDSQLRKKLGQWRLENSINVDAIIAQFANEPGFQSLTGDLCLPLHEETEPELTGEFVLVTSGPDGDRVAFHDFSAGGRVDVPLLEFAELYPARRLRFWIEDYPHELTIPSSLPASTNLSLRSHPGEETASSEQPGDGSSSEEFFAELESFVEREERVARTTARRTIATLQPQSFPEAHPGIPSLHSLGRDTDREGRQIIELEVPVESRHPRDEFRETYGIYEDSEVVIMSLDGTSGFPVDATILSLDAPQLSIQVDWRSSEDKATAEAAFVDPEAEFALGLLLNPIPFQRQRAAIQGVAKAPGKRALVKGEASPKVGQYTASVYRGALNESQQAALRGGLGAESVFCIHGPPGTGKTRTLVALIRTAVENRQRVLACSHSNQGIDNLVAGDSVPGDIDYHSLHGLVDRESIRVSRVGENTDHPIVEEQYTDVPHYEADVVAATTSAAHRFRRNQFDLVVFDEASQATIPSSLIPFLAGEQLVLAGDHKQLPPFHASEGDAEEYAGISLFEHLIDCYDDSIYTQLQTQYRMHPAIASFPNQEFYNGAIENAAGTEELRLDDVAPLEAVDVTGAEQQTSDGSYYNQAEADVVETEIRRLKSAGVSFGNIGVITPYSAQVDLIRSRLQNTDSDGLHDRITVDTVDSFQGGERSAIILSFVRSNDTGDIGFLGFPMEGPRRLNVALTRAKKRLVLIGDWETLTTVPADTQVDATATPVYQRLHKHLQDQSVIRDEGV